MLRHRAVHYAAFAVVGLLVLSPVLGPVNRDDFPLSPFAMFADDKDANTTITQAVGVRADGTEMVLGPKLLGTDEVLQAKETLSLVPRSGKKARADFCERFAAKIAAEADLATIAKIEVRTVTYESLAYFADPKAPPLRKNVHVSCQVVRP
jgi:hypothetical protein